VASVRLKDSVPVPELLEPDPPPQDASTKMKNNAGIQANSFRDFIDLTPFFNYVTYAIYICNTVKC
jgi:hypothetical protein